MKTRSLLVLLLLAAAGCKGSSARPGVRLAKPNGVALFHGYSSRSPAAAHPYVAVANARGDELRLIDAVDNRVIMSPTDITPLAVPVDPRPALVVAGSLNDPDTTGTTPVERPWLLAAASTGMVARPQAGANEPVVSSQIQVVATWTPATAVARGLAIDLADYPAVQDAVILSLIVAPKPAFDAGSGTWVAAPGEARLLVGLSGGRLMVFEFARDPGDGISIMAGAAAPVVQDLGFEPVSLALAPDLVHLYIATPDPIGSVEGVAELDASAPVGAWPIRGLDARAPTTHVAVGMIGEFSAYRTDGFLPGHSLQPWEANPIESDLFTTPALRVYAALDPSKCGRSFRISCGVAVLDPVAGGLLPDPAVAPTATSITAKQRYLTPIQVPGTVLDLALVLPPAIPPSDVTNAIPVPPKPPLVPTQPAMMVVAPGSGRRLTSAVLAVASSDGRIYVADAGHWAVPSDISIINTFKEKVPTTRTRVVTAVNGLPNLGYDAQGNKIYWPEGTPYIALWSDSELPSSFTNPPNAVPAGLGLFPDYLYDTTGMVIHPHVTPGYTESETWDITFQGTLPGLSLRSGQVSLTTTAVAGTNQTTGWMAIQQATNLGGAEPFRSVARLYDPSLAVHVGDIVQILAYEPDPSNRMCPQGTFEARVTDFLYPTAEYPGGAVQIAASSCTDSDGKPTACPTNTCHDSLGIAVPCPGDPSCLSGRGTREALITIRAESMVLVGSGTGYAGRPPVVVMDPSNAPLFRFEYEDEDALSCPMLEPGAPWPPAVCDAACRSECERLVLARKARRYYYVTSSLVCDGWSASYKQACSDIWRNLEWPITTGPVLAFRVGLNIRAGTDPAGYDNNSASNPFTARGAILEMVTASGVAPMSRVPRSGTTAYGAVLPTGLTTFDRSAATGNADDGVRVYASYPENTVLDFSPAGSITDVGTIR